MSTRTLDGNEVHLLRIHGQVQRRCPVGPRLDCLDLAHLHTAHLHLGIGVHHQAGTVRNNGDRFGFGEAAAEKADGEREYQHDRNNEAQARQRAHRTTVHRLVSPLSRQVEVAVGTVDGQGHEQCHRHHDNQ